MTAKTNEIENLLAAKSVQFQLLPADEGDAVRQHWLSTFAARVKKDTGVWVHNRFRWHGFSYGFQNAIEGEDAMVGYQDQWPAPYVVFDEDDSWAYACTSAEYPDLTSLRSDIYVAHHGMKWTMAFTHEQPDIGPFWATKSDNAC